MQQQGYQAPVPSGREGLAIASMILGILALVLFCVVYVSLPAAILAIVFAGVSLRSSNRGMAIAGLVCGLISVAFSLLWFLVLSALLFGASSAVSSLAGSLGNGIAEVEIEKEVKSHLGATATIDGGPTAIQVTRRAGNEWEGTGTATDPKGKKVQFDCVIEIGPTEKGHDFHRLVRFTTK